MVASPLGGGAAVGSKALRYSVPSLSRLLRRYGPVPTGAAARAARRSGSVTPRGRIGSTMAM
jgi:hypothetical protein